MPPRILIAEFNHETNTFSKLPTGLAQFRARLLRVGNEMTSTYAGTATEIGGFLDAGRRYGWEITPTVGATASPSGLVTKEAFDFVARHILHGIRTSKPDAILLALHGAMVCEHDFDGEGALLEVVRSAVGRDFPVGVTLDLHANVTDRMCALADTLISYRTYPHVDHVETATICADLMHRMLAGEIRPQCHVARRDTIYGLDMGRTTAPGAMTEILERARRLEREPGVLSVSINAGFPWADIPDAGPTAVVVGESRDPRFQRMADDLADFIWETRGQKVVELVTVEQALSRAKIAARAGKPVVLADYADNPGGGGYGDSPGLLRGMIDAGLENAAFSMLYDPESAAACHSAGEGATISLRLGGKIDPAFGPPIQVSGKVTKVFDGKFMREGPMLKGIPVDMGPSAVVKVGGIEIVIGSERFQNADLMYFKSAGIEPTQRSVLGVKSMQHFRAAYAPIAGEIITVDEGGGCCSENFKALSFTHVRRPVYPLDLD